jgi:hypothetical protein
MGVLTHDPELAVGSILSYVFYWLAVIAALVYMKWSEGRTKIFGFESKASREIRERREKRQQDAAAAAAEKATGSVDDEKDKISDDSHDMGDKESASSPHTPATETERVVLGREEAEIQTLPK